jgi:hypothetical protein
MMSRGTKRRATANEAENKIKSALEELMGWSESKEDSFEASFYAFYDASEPEDAGSSSKKPKIDNTNPTAKKSQKNPTNKQGAAASSSKLKNDTKATSNKKVADPALDTAEWDYDMITESELEELMLMESVMEEERVEEKRLEEERKLKERDDRRAARLVHSNRRMCLSRRHFQRLSRIDDASPIYSPLCVRHLTFSPSSVAILVTRRTYPIYSPLAARHLTFAPSSVATLVTRRT